MKLGINLPQFGALASPDNVSQVAQAAEQLGCEAVWVQERLLRPTQPRQPYGPLPSWPAAYRTVLDPLLALTYAAAVTRRIKLGTSVIDTLFHSPVVLGRQLATLDQLSGGRVIAGLGQGWSEDEFEVVNVAPTRKGARFEEFLQALLAVWGPDPVRYQGQFYRIPASEIGPKPRQPRLPVLIGGYAPAAIQRAGRLGLGLNPILVAFEVLEGVLQSFRAAAREAGHNPDQLPVIVRGNMYLSPDRIEGERQPLSGSLEQATEDVRRLAGLGVDQLFIDFYLMTDTPVDRQLEVLQAFSTAAG